MRLLHRFRQTENDIPNEIAIQLVQAGESYLIRVTGLEDMPFTWDQNEHAHVLRAFGESRETPDEDTLKVAGRSLYNALFHRALEQLFSRLQGRAQQAGKYLRLRLVLPDELMAIPWEMMHDGQQFLALNPDVTLVRSMPDTSFDQPVRQVQRLRVLYLAATPRDTVSLKVRDLWDELSQLLRAPASGGLGWWSRQRTFELEAVFHATVDDLREHLVASKYHVLIFSGHGTYNEIIFDDGLEARADGTRQAGYSDPVSADDFAQIVSDAGIQLLYLAKCEPRHTEEAGTGLQSFARTLASQSDIPAIVAMQGYIGNHQANLITARFFQRLAELQPVDRALTEGRIDARINTFDRRVRRDVIAPVLYLQARTGTLFRPYVNYALRAALTFIVLLMVTLVAGAYVSNQTQQQLRLESEIALSEEIETRLQTLGHLNQREFFPLSDLLPQADSRPAQGYQLSAPVMAADNHLWLSLQTRQAHGVIAIDTTGQPVSDLIATGQEPLQPVRDGHWLWVSNLADESLSRVDTRTHTVDTISLDVLPERPLVTSHAVWVHSPVNRRLIRIDHETLAIDRISLPPATRLAFQGDDAIWMSVSSDVCERDGGCLLRVADTRDMPLQLDRLAVRHHANALYAFDALWLWRDNTVFRVEPAVDNPQIDPVALQVPVDNLTAGAAAIWAFSTRADSLVRVNPQTLEPTVYQTRQPQRLIHSTSRHVWVAGADNSLRRLQLSDGQITKELLLPGFGERNTNHPDNQLVQVIDNQLWITLPAFDQVLVVDVNSGDELRRMFVCDNPLPPVFDGLNLWFTCRDDNQLLQIPAFNYLLSAQNRPASASALALLSGNQREHPPVAAAGHLWLVQEQVGRIVAYNPVTNAEVNTQQFDGPLLPLQTHDGYLWTATESPARLIRIQPRLLPDGSLDVLVQTPEDPLPGEVQEFQMIHNHVWVLHRRLLDNSDTPGLTRYHRDTLERASQQAAGLVVSDIGYTGDDVWLGISQVSRGMVQRFNADTGELTDTYTLPDPAYAPWAPVAIDDTIWFVGGVPSFVESVDNLDLTIDFLARTENARYIYEFDPVTTSWGRSFPVPAFPQRPVVVDENLWMALYDTPTVVNGIEDANTGPLYGLDTRRSQSLGPYRPCDYTWGIYPAGSYIWGGCIEFLGEGQHTETVWLFPRQNPQNPRVHRNVGSRPAPPVQVDNQIWFTFRDTNTLAVFDIESGDLIRRFATGESPAPPVYYEGYIWIYNTRSGTLQRLSPDKIS